MQLEYSLVFSSKKDCCLWHFFSGTLIYIGCIMAGTVWCFSFKWLILGPEVSCLCDFTRGALRKPLGHHKPRCFTSHRKWTSICCSPALAQPRLRRTPEITLKEPLEQMVCSGFGFILQSPVDGWLPGLKNSFLERTCDLPSLPVTRVILWWRLGGRSC